ncbi:MAG: Mur ligase family protein [Wenzhouxiangella sp.]|jgi:UDP-N-acetylmuramyl tripeptide synthase|nr:Mur ligase family protein [Wenzhouxiangella sp.]
MELLDCRRLTGPNLLWDRPSVVADIACEAGQVDTISEAFEREIRSLHRALGWDEPAFSCKTRVGGLSIAFDGPIDRLYAGIALAEAAWAKSALGQSATDAIGSILARAEEEANPALLTLQQAAGHHAAPFLWDDDEVSIGQGQSARVWPTSNPPCPEEIDWALPARIPTALITGTNGKTTTARMTARILGEAGHCVGLTSTEGIWLGGQRLDEGDYAGPGGARMVLRQTEASAAVLETARGGLLRRGLGVEQADAAVITNIAADHLGDFGSGTMEELLEIKWIISRAVRKQGTLVLNADDGRLVRQAESYPGRITWFSLNPDHRKARFRTDQGWLIEEQDGERTALCQISEIPLAMGGAARHNIANALAAAAVCRSLGADGDAIAAGLTGLQPADNPGRGNLYELNGIRLFVDFAHNPQAIQAIADMAAAWPARRRLLAFSQAGDRTDDLLRECARRAWSLGPERVIVSELAKYARGRAPGEIFGIMRDELLHNGCPDNQIVHVETELQALAVALRWAKPGDLLVLLILADAEPVRQELARLGARLSSQPPR